MILNESAISVLAAFRSYAVYARRQLNEHSQMQKKAGVGGWGWECVSANM